MSLNDSFPMNIFVSPYVDGYTKIPTDLNLGQFKSRVYLAYTTDSSLPPLVEIKFANEKERVGAHYSKLDQPINPGMLAQ